jgi:hypothetical protein
MTVICYTFSILVHVPYQTCSGIISFLGFKINNLHPLPLATKYVIFFVLFFEFKEFCWLPLFTLDMVLSRRAKINDEYNDRHYCTTLMERFAIPSHVKNPFVLDYYLLRFYN